MAQENESPWKYKPDSGPNNRGDGSDYDDNPAPKAAASRTIAWEASEYIEHRHDSKWYLELAIATVILAAVIYLISRDIIATITIIIVGIIVGFFANNKPRVVKYEITGSSLNVNGKSHSFSNFKSFAVIREGQFSSVNLFPLKRFVPPVSAYFEEKDEKKIIDALGNHLPYEERKIDSIDRLTRRLRL